MGNVKTTSTRIFPATKLTGEKVKNLQDEDFGKIEEVMIDLIDGRIAYAVLSFGGFLGMGDKLFAIPWEALSLSEEKKTVYLDVDREVLKEAPGFDKDNWPANADRTWLTDIYEYYGYEPYWNS